LARQTASLFNADSHWIILVAGSALIIRSIGLSRLSMWGDEILSIRDASELGRTWNGIGYFIVLRSVLHFTNESFWLRMPSVVLGAAATVPFYLFLRREAGTLAARTGALLYALSPFAVLYSQEVRFYGLYLFSGALGLLLLSAAMQGTSWRSRAALVLSWLFLLVSHVLANLAILCQCLTVLWQKNGPAVRYLMLVALAMLASVAIIIVFLAPALVGDFYSWLSYRVGSAPGVSYAGARGLSAALLMKIPFAFYFFGLGENIHPLTLPITAPAVLLMGYLAVRGLWYSRRAAPLLYTCAWTMLVIPVLVLFLVLDLLSPPDAGLAQPKYICFGLYPFLGLIAMGILSHAGRWRQVTGIGAGLVTIAGLGAYFQAGWSYNSHKLVNWQRATEVLQQWARPDSFLVADGRSAAELTYYLPDWPAARQAILDNLSSEPVSRMEGDVIVTAYPAFENVSLFNEKMRPVQAGRFVADGYYQNNLTLVRYSPLPVKASDLPQAAMPCDLIDRRYLDLALPQTVKVEGDSLRIVGGFSLDATANRARNISVVPGRRDCRDLIVVSNATELRFAALGTPIADIQLRYRDGFAESHPIRIGIETGDWSDGNALTAGKVVYKWKKRPQLVGNKHTATSWQWFEARWYAVRLALAHRTQPTAIQIDYRGDAGQLQIWSIAFR
jgi:hypothetical protein